MKSMWLKSESFNTIHSSHRASKDWTNEYRHPEVFITFQHGCVDTQLVYHAVNNISTVFIFNNSIFYTYVSILPKFQFLEYSHCVVYGVRSIYSTKFTNVASYHTTHPTATVVRSRMNSVSCASLDNLWCEFIAVCVLETCKEYVV